MSDVNTVLDSITAAVHVVWIKDYIQNLMSKYIFLNSFWFFFSVCIFSNISLCIFYLELKMVTRYKNNFRILLNSLINNFNIFQSNNDTLLLCAPCGDVSPGCRGVPATVHTVPGLLCNWDPPHGNMPTVGPKAAGLHIHSHAAVNSSKVALLPAWQCAAISTWSYW